MRVSFALLLLLAAPLAAQPIVLEGTICRINRGADRMIVAADRGPRLRVTTGEASVTLESFRHEVEDLRVGDRIRLRGNRAGSSIRATSIDARVRTADPLNDSLVPIKTIVGRFVESDGGMVTLNVAGPGTMRVKASGNYKPGELLAVGDTVTIITDREDAGCQAFARLNESKEDTAAREKAEKEFLNWSR